MEGIACWIEAGFTASFNYDDEPYRKHCVVWQAAQLVNDWNLCSSWTLLRI